MHTPCTDAGILHNEFFIISTFFGNTMNLKLNNPDVIQVLTFSFFTKMWHIILYASLSKVPPF